jgi:hypothetical protein
MTNGKLLNIKEGESNENKHENRCHDRTGTLPYFISGCCTAGRYTLAHVPS